MCLVVFFVLRLRGVIVRSGRLLKGLKPMHEPKRKDG